MDRWRENSHFFQQQYWLALIPLFIPQQGDPQTHVITQRSLSETGLAQLASTSRLYWIYTPEYTMLVKTSVPIPGIQLKNFSPYKSCSTHFRAQISFIAAISILSSCFYISKTQCFLQPALLPFSADSLPSAHNLQILTCSFTLAWIPFPQDFCISDKVSSFLHIQSHNQPFWTGPPQSLPIKLTTGLLLAVSCLEQIYPGRQESLSSKDTKGFLIMGVPGFPERSCSCRKPDHSLQVSCHRNRPLSLHLYHLPEGTLLLQIIILTQAEGC